MTMTDPSGHKAKALAASDEKISACPAAAWGAAVLVGEGGGVALAASEGGLLVAGAGAVALTGGLILVGIGIVGIAGGFYLFYMGCIE
jgi:hypothetical protein